VNNTPFAHQMQICRCPLCGLVCEEQRSSDVRCRCPRCHTDLPGRTAGRFQLSWVLLIAAMIFYIPANVVPVMSTHVLGYGSESTILSGVLAFWRNGSWGIAIIIFIASVVVPCMKFLSLGLLLITSGQRRHWARRERTKLYRITEWIGCWSMLDVVVVAVVCALVQFHSLSEAEPRAGILFFGLAVILSMLCALSFQPKAIWEDKQ